MNKLARIKGGFFGVACGDALGGTLEFLNKNEAVKKYGYLTEIIGGGVWELTPGEVTDDTNMTIAVAKGILKDPENPIEKIGQFFLELYKSNPKDIGNTVKIALTQYEIYNNWEAASKKTNDILCGKTAGNGTLMRCIPIPLYYNDIERIKKISREQSLMTHYDDQAAEACEIYNAIIHEYLNGEEKLSIMKKLIGDHRLYKDVFEMTKDSLKPSGYVVETLICALWCFLNTNTFKDAVCEAVNLCGDSDTVGAITGGLAGVYYGFEAIPDNWKNTLLDRDELSYIAKKFHDEGSK